MLPGGLTRDRDFLKLWSGQAISKNGSTITSFGLPLTAASLCIRAKLGHSVSALRRVARRVTVTTATEFSSYRLVTVVS